MSEFGTPLRKELDGLLSARHEALSSACKVKGANDRVDGLTLVCRDVLRASSLCVVEGAVRYFDGRCYALVPMDEVRITLSNLLVDRGASPTDVRKMGSMHTDVILEKKMVRDDALCFENGVFNLDSMVFHPGFSAERIVVERLDYPYDEAAECPRFSAFLDDVLPDKDEQEAVMEFFSLAYVDRRRVSVEKMALFIGNGANGKSVLFDVIQRVLGPESVSTMDPAQLSDDKMLPYVAHARLNFAPDVKRSSAFDSALKALSSGQRVTARRIFADAEQVVCPPIIFALNDLPRMLDTSDGFFRRLLVFPFDVTIPPQRQDKTLADTICRTERPGIFRWLLDARRRLEQRRWEFRPSEGMNTAFSALEQRYRSGTAPVRAYLAKMGYGVEPAYDGQPSVPVSQTAIAQGLGNAISRTAISRELSSYGIYVLRNNNERFYNVYKLL